MFIHYILLLKFKARLARLFKREVTIPDLYLVYHFAPIEELFINSCVMLVIPHIFLSKLNSAKFTQKSFVF